MSRAKAILRVLRRKWFYYPAMIGILVVVLLFGGAAFALRSGVLTSRVTATLAESLNCDVSMDMLSVRLLPRITVSGTNLSIRLRGHAELPPFVAVKSFSVNLGLLTILRRHIDTVLLDGLEINVPPGYARADLPGTDAGQHTDSPSAPPTGRERGSLFKVSHVIARNGVLNFVGKTPNNHPLMFAINDLDIAEAGIDAPMHFVAHVINPLPEGLVNTTGTFGPWRRDSPSETPLAGHYVTDSVDMGTIKGIGGHAASEGNYTGQLSDIRAVGESRIPDFSLDLGGQPSLVTTKFTVTIDGTTGTVRLDHVDAKLIDTSMTVTGAVVNLPGKDTGHDTVLNVTSLDGKVEDVLHLVMSTPKPILVGGLKMAGTLHLPPGEEKPRDRFEINGTFSLAQGTFTDKFTQDKLRELSRRAQGKDEDEALGRIASNLQGTFALKNGTLSMPMVKFTVNGALIELAGTYELNSEAIDFTGRVNLAATLSAAVGGFKGALIKPFNKLFSRDGAGAVVPVKITGTRNDPKFSVRMGAMFKRER